MCIFRFNPPAPSGPCKQCRRCPCTPNYWRLDVAAFAGYADSWALLKYEPHPELPSSTYCYWTIRQDLLQGTDTPRPRAANDFFAAHNSWHLGTYEVLSFVTGPGAGVEFNDWLIWGGGPGLVAYTLDPPFSGYFRCLEPNTFRYWGAQGDPGGEENPETLGWPAELTITPYYP